MYTLSLFSFALWCPATSVWVCPLYTRQSLYCMTFLAPPVLKLADSTTIIGATHSFTVIVFAPCVDNLGTEYISSELYYYTCHCVRCIICGWEFHRLFFFSLTSIVISHWLVWLCYTSHWYEMVL